MRYTSVLSAENRGVSGFVFSSGVSLWPIQNLYFFLFFFFNRASSTHSIFWGLSNFPLQIMHI